MKKLYVLVGVLLLAASTSFAQKMNLDQILEKYYKATGFDKLQNVTSVVMSGSVTTWVVMPVKIYRVRPNKLRMERDVNDITGLTVFDGKNGWMTAPWTKNPKPQVAAGPILADLQVQADFDGVLYDWKTKGHVAELVGVEKIGDLDVYRIKLTRKDGGVEYYLIDCKNFLLQRKLTYRVVKEKEVEIENNFSDYRNCEGIMFAFENENKIGGQPNSTIQFDSIELNTTVDPKLFDMSVN